MDYVLAVDAGGTSTRCAVASSDAVCLGYAKAGGGNPVSAGTGRALAAFADGIGQALAQSGVAGADVGHVAFSMAGGLTTTELPAFRDLLTRLGIGVEPHLAGDLLGNFSSGTHLEEGYCLDAGTGAGAVRVEGAQIARVADSLGWLLGDAGSGFWIGLQAARAAFADLDRRGPATAMTALVLERLGVAAGDYAGVVAEGRPQVLLEGLRRVYDMRPIELSRLAAVALQAAALPAADPVAARIVDRAAEELANTLRTVVAPGVPGPVVLAGGVLTAHHALRDRVKAALAYDLPDARFIAMADGMVGPLVIALRLAGVEVGPERFAALGSSLAALRGRDGTGQREPEP